VSKKSNLKDILVSIIENTQNSKKKQNKLPLDLKNKNVSTIKQSIYGKDNEKNKPSTNDNFKKVNNKNVLNFNFLDISIEKKKQNHVDSLDIMRYEQQWKEKKKVEKREYFLSLKTLNRRKVVMEENKNFIIAKKIENSYAKILRNIPLKNIIQLFKEYQQSF